MMIPEERRRNILVRLKENDFLKIDDLAEKLGVSKITVIRDIQLLKNQGLVKKIHGGIKLDGPSKNSIESSFYERMQKNYSKKLEIAGKSLPFLEGKQTVFLDSSSTVFVLATEIFKSHYNEKNLITNSPAIIVEAMNYPGVHLISTGGELRQEFNIFGGSWVNEFLEKINIDCAFVSAAGISAEGKLTTNNKDLASILSLVFKKAREVNLIADSTKFFIEGMLNITSLSDCSRIITDSSIEKNVLKKIRKVSNVEIVF